MKLKKVYFGKNLSVLLVQVLLFLNKFQVKSFQRLLEVVLKRCAHLEADLLLFERLWQTDILQMEVKRYDFSYVLVDVQSVQDGAFQFLKWELTC